MVALKEPQRHPRVSARWLQRWFEAHPFATLYDAAFAVASLQALGSRHHQQAGRARRTLPSRGDPNTGTLKDWRSDTGSTALAVWCPRPRPGGPLNRRRLLHHADVPARTAALTGATLPPRCVCVVRDSQARTVVTGADSDVWEWRGAADAPLPALFFLVLVAEARPVFGLAAVIDPEVCGG